MTSHGGGPSAARPLPFGVHAVTITSEHGLEWSEHPDPVPGETDLVVAVTSAGLNAADLLQRLGLYPAPPGFPQDIPGMEFAGEVVAIGPRVSRFEIGDRVMALVGGGAQAELAITNEATALEVPEDLDLDAAGGFMEAAVTAYDALIVQAGLAAGEKLLVTGAAGGVGIVAVQLGAAAGATVIASTRHPELESGLIEFGAAIAVPPVEANEFGPFDVILELVGGDGTGESVSSLAIGGRLVVIGVGAGSRFQLDMLSLMQKRARISGSTMRSRSLAERAVIISAVERRVLPFVDSGAMVVPLAASFPMPHAAQAYDRFSAGAKLGKIVLMSEATNKQLTLESASDS
ncbi:MAG: zinc-binding dehydrogenase [Acidimicrobiales bacterium]